MQASAKDLLVSDLRRLRQESGYPSLNEIARLSQGKFSKNTIDDHLSGRRAGIPNWRITSAYINACREFAKSTGLNIDSLGTMEEWRVRWQSAQTGSTSTVSPIRDSRNAITYSMADQEPPIEIPDQAITISGSRGYSDTTAGITALEQNFRIDIPSLRKSLPTNSAMLVMANGPIIGTCFGVSDDLVTIGRGPESNIILNDPTVSRRHAVIHRYGATFTVRDVGSRNGTYLHQMRLTEESPLPSNEELQIGIFRMWFIQGTQVSD